MKRSQSGPGTSTSQEEARLIERAKQNDKQAISELYRQHVDAIYRYIYYRVPDAAVAEDLTAEVFLRALEALPDFQVTGAPFESWLYRIAQTRTAKYWRRQHRRQEVKLVSTLPAQDPSPEDMINAEVDWQRAMDLLAQLTEDQQDVVMLRYFGEMSLSDVATTLGKTIGAVKSLQHRALASLARLLGKQRSRGRRE